MNCVVSTALPLLPKQKGDMSEASITHFYLVGRKLVLSS